MSEIFRANKKETTIITIDSLLGHLWAPSPQEIEEIRNWVKDHLDVWPDCFKEMSSLFGFHFEFETWPEIQNNKTYVWLVDRYHFFNDLDRNTWQEVFDEADKSNFIFILGPVSIKRVNRDLLPFL